MWEYNHNELYHYGIKGQRWGIRRYVNTDGTLTPEGIARYGNIQDKNQVKALEKQDEPFFRTESKIADVYKFSDEHLMKQNDKAQKRYEKLAAKTKELADTDVKVLEAKRKADEASGKLKEFDEKFDYIINRAGDKDIIKLAEKARQQKIGFNLMAGPFDSAFADFDFMNALEEDYQKNQKKA